MTVLELYLALVAELETVLGCAIGKGFPAWERSRITVADLPVGAIQMARPGLVMPSRIGAGPSRESVAWSVWVFAQDEVQLADLTGKVLDWLKQTPMVGVNSVRVSLALESADRYDSQFDVQQEDHGIALTLITQW